MNKKELFYGTCGLILGLIITLLVTKSAVNSNKNQEIPQMSNIDAHFIEQMIPHHEDAITTANLALQKAKQEEIKKLAQNIIDSQSKEISQMKTWYKNWYGKDLPTGNQVMMQSGMMGNDSDAKRLEESTNFDKAFIEEMIPHHQMAVIMASMLKGGTSKAEMKQLADDIIDAQSAEIEQMREWYRDWRY